MSPLTYIIGSPLLAALVLAFVPRTFRPVMRAVAVLATFFSAVLAVKIFLQFQTATPEYQFVEQHSWVAALGINYHVGVDGINVGLVLMGVSSRSLPPVFSWGDQAAREGVLHSAVGDDWRHSRRIRFLGPVLLLFLP